MTSHRGRCFEEERGEGENGGEMGESRARHAPRHTAVSLASQSTLRDFGPLTSLDSLHQTGLQLKARASNVREWPMKKGTRTQAANRNSARADGTMYLPHDLTDYGPVSFHTATASSPSQPLATQHTLG
ncbi:hypothetical protein RRG08_024461 [Elysia crispata]|uniref:Uncharacterized protein n=1 Tax=Elysia crispata TaxID=231223 RepID=A0AAE0YQ12_9GAST|nr:hypothetical protein RRG08_024461 [Elysia crispata]